MENIEEYRKAINDIDGQMAELFKKRMAISKNIADYKKELGLPVKDEKREEQIYARCAERIDDPEIESYYVNFQKNVIDLSCEYQTRLMEGIRVSYSGVEGAYAYMAAKKMFPGAQLIACSNFGPAYNAVLEGKADFAVLPLENSYAGDVGAVMDLAFDGPLYVNRVCNLNVEHSLIGVPGATIADIKTVVSHPQALMQCSEFLQENSQIQQISTENTAVSAQAVKNGGDPSHAAIGREACAGLYGLEVLKDDIVDDPSNTTRFIIVSSKKIYSEDADRVSIVFEASHQTGSLYSLLSHIIHNDLNMTKIESRPVPGKAWEYRFFVDFEGNLSEASVKNALRGIIEEAIYFKILGNY